MKHQYLLHVLLLFSEGNYWNAASFSSPASYLHFPSFREETSTDISFYFKTSSTHGVFLENLGTTDLLHIELIGASVCTLHMMKDFYISGTELFYKEFINPNSVDRY